MAGAFFPDGGVLIRARRFFHILLTGLLFLLLAVSGASAWLLLSQGGLVQSLALLE